MYVDMLGKTRVKLGLHTHTTLSDGKATPEEAARIYLEEGYDAIAITDHWRYGDEDEIEGLKIIEPRIFTDSRGYFFESFSQREFEEKVCRTVFVQDNESKSTAGVVRGLHFQKPPFTQSKLVRARSAIFLTIIGKKRSDRTFILPTIRRRSKKTKAQSL